MSSEQQSCLKGFAYGTKSPIVVCRVDPGGHYQCILVHAGTSETDSEPVSASQCQCNPSNCN